MTFVLIVLIILPSSTDFSAPCTTFLNAFLNHTGIKDYNTNLLCLRHYIFISVSGERDGELKLKSYLILGNASIFIHFCDITMCHL